MCIPHIMTGVPPLLTGWDPLQKEIIMTVNNTTTSRFNKATQTKTEGTNTMKTNNRSIKASLRNIGKAIGNTVSATATIAAVSTEVLADATGAIAAGATQVVPTIKEVSLIVPTTIAAYRAEDKGTTFDQEEKEIYAQLPSTLPEAVKQSYIASARLAAQLMKEEA